MRFKSNGKESKRKNKTKARFDKTELIKLKKENIEKKEDIDKLRKRVEKHQNKKYKKQIKTEKVKFVEKFGELSRRKRFKVWMVVLILIFAIFVSRIGWIQFAMGDELKEMAFEQQSLDRAINPRRGTIYDSTGKTIWQ